MKPLILSVLLLVSVSIFSQKNFQGKAVYQKITKVDLSRLDKNKKMSPERKKMITEMLKKNANKTYVLNFNKRASIYKEEEQLATPGVKGVRTFNFGGSGAVEYKNVVDKKLLTASESFGKQFLITNDSKIPAWEMGSETKKIGNYTCYKATFKKKKEVRSFRGFSRKKEDKKKMDSIAKLPPKEVLVTAWYTPQIPVSNGPEQYWGLPGLILEVSEGKSTILCKEIVLNPTEKTEIKEPTKGDKVTRKEYRKILSKKMEEMRERFGGRRGGRRGR